MNNTTSSVASSASRKRLNDSTGSTTSSRASKKEKGELDKSLPPSSEDEENSNTSDNELDGSSDSENTVQSHKVLSNKVKPLDLTKPKENPWKVVKNKNHNTRSSQNTQPKDFYFSKKVNIQDHINRLESEGVSSFPVILIKIPNQTKAKKIDPIH